MCLKKLGIEPGLYEKSVLYLVPRPYGQFLANKAFTVVATSAAVAASTSAKSGQGLGLGGLASHAGPDCSSWLLKFHACEINASGGPPVVRKLNTR